MNLIPFILLLNKHKQLWLWPASCTNQPKTPSFRTTSLEDSVFMNPNKRPFTEVDQVEVTTLGSCFTNSTETASVSSSESDYSGEVETIVRGARSDRLFFEPESTCLILETQGSGKQCTSEIGGDDEHGGGDDGGGLPYKESVAMVMESENPYVDFKRSMEEMVEIHGLNDWDCLELLGWYLRMNEKNNHEFIIGAFVDLLIGISGGSGDVLFLDHIIASFSSVASTFTSPSL